MAEIKMAYSACRFSGGKYAASFLNSCLAYW